jgi:acyl dehydratase
MSQAGPYFLEDLAVGQIFRSGNVAVEIGAVKAFAAAYDPQPFHLDEQAAGASVFGGLVASGWHTAALTMRLLVDGELKVAGGLVGAGVEAIRWPRPVYPGDVLGVESEILEVRPSSSKPDRGVVRLRSTTFNQQGQSVMEQVATLIVPRRPV